MSQSKGRAFSGVDTWERRNLAGPPRPGGSLKELETQREPSGRRSGEETLILKRKLGNNGVWLRTRRCGTRVDEKFVASGDFGIACVTASTSACGSGALRVRALSRGVTAAPWDFLALHTPNRPG